MFLFSEFKLLILNQCQLYPNRLRGFDGVGVPWNLWIQNNKNYFEKQYNNIEFTSGVIFEKRNEKHVGDGNIL